MNSAPRTTSADSRWHGARGDNSRYPSQRRGAGDELAQGDLPPPADRGWDTIGALTTMHAIRFWLRCGPRRACRHCALSRSSRPFAIQSREPAILSFVDSTFRAAGPRARDRRGWQPRRPGERRSGSRHPHRARHQERRARPKGLGRSLPRARTDDAARGPLRDRLCVAELSQTSARAGRRRSAQLRAVVRRLGAPHPPCGRFFTDVCAADLACEDGLASRWSDRLTRNTGAVTKNLALTN